MKKKTKIIKPRNKEYAASLGKARAALRVRTARDKTKYNRKKKHKGSSND